MIFKTKKFFYAFFRKKVFLKIWSLVETVLVLLALFMGKYDAALGILIIGLLVLAVYCFRPDSRINSVLTDGSSVKQRWMIFAVAVVTITLCVLPMSASPIWNGEIPEHRNQYEVMAESILKGHLYMDYGDDTTALQNLQNPYDPAQREGISFRWDHAFYNGHYYMYFGIVPVFLLFLPFRVITGMALTTYHATQIFVAFSIMGIFALFYQLCRSFFKKLPLGIYLSLSVAFSVMSVWYSIGMPALYCTAITAGICMMVWSLYFFIKAVYVSKTESRQLLSAFFGSLFGALAFGCRPPIALANILVIPLLVVFLKQRKFTGKLFGKLVAAASPYIVIGVLLMVYNYVRFGSFTEFGQSYQLTVADQTMYNSFSDAFVWYRQINGIFENFIAFKPLTGNFPFVSQSSVFVNFPILLISFAAWKPSVNKQLKENHIRPFVYTLFAAVLLITFMNVLWTPYLLERYRMDLYFLMGILCFTVIGFLYQAISEEKKKYFSCFIMIFALVTAIKSVLLYLIPQSSNLTSYYPNVLKAIEKVFFFWK